IPKPACKPIISIRSRMSGGTSKKRSYPTVGGSRHRGTPRTIKNALHWPRRCGSCVGASWVVYPNPADNSIGAKTGETARLLPPHLATWLKAMPSTASTGAGVRRPQRLPVQPTPLHSISDASGSLSCFWAPIGPLWCVDRTHPTGYDGPEIDLGGDISWRGESGAARKGPARKARLPGEG